MSSTSEDFGVWIEALNGESDRGVAIVGCSYLDTMLGRILQAFCAPNAAAARLVIGIAAPLGSFSAKITAAHALGLVSEAEVRELDQLRRIRNEFAHQVDCALSSPKVRKLLASLTAPMPTENVSPRGRLTLSFAWITTRLIERMSLARFQQRTEAPQL
ncbi:MAG: transcriptional regulator [Brevundimonas sp.]|nr:MAG: transcriptional regulator [Brevundimonas sp.]